MKKELKDYGQYKHDIFAKLNFGFEPGKKILDLGCGDCSDAEILKDFYNLDVFGVDIYKHANAEKVLGEKFTLNPKGVFDLKYEDGFFDYIFLHDVLHHVDEENQSFDSHVTALKNLKRLVANNGFIIIVEGNRFNPLFYPHMVKMLGHEHFSQSYFKKIIKEAYGNLPKLHFFEAHNYPDAYVSFWKVYEKLMDLFSPKPFLAYNIAIVENKDKVLNS